MHKSLPNLLVLGASGNVARAFLRRLAGQRSRFGTVTLVDMNKRILRDPYIDLRTLKAKFIQWRLNLQKERGAYQTFLKRRKINVVLDVTTHDTLSSLGAADQAGVSFLNTSLADENAKVDALVAATYDRALDYAKAPHILCAGMNPGVVNFWVTFGISKYGKPSEVIHFEYDTSMTADGWKPVITWSPHEFIEETIKAPAGFAEGRQVNKIFPNPLMVREPLRPVMEPVWKLNSYPEGFLVLHEENLTLARRFGIKTRFIYAIDPRTMDHMAKLYKKNGMLKETDFLLGDNVAHRLNGEDTIGVMLDYPDRRVYYLNSISNSSITGANATCTQVALGIYAALLTLTMDRISPGLHFVGGLYGTTYEHLLLSNMRVEEFVFEKKDGRLKLTGHSPAIQARTKLRTQRVLF